MSRIRMLPVLRVAAGALVVIAVLGFLLGWVWSALAPGQRMRVVTRDGDLTPLQLESWHRFDALAIFLLLAFASGVLIAIGLWALRRWRGPGMLLVAVLGSLLTSWIAMRTGLLIVGNRYSVPEAPALGTVVEQAPVLESTWVIVAAPTAVAMMYGILAVSSNYQDLNEIPIRRADADPDSDPDSETDPDADPNSETDAESGGPERTRSA